MGDKLLVRVYDVDFGDCIYVQVPDKDRSYHILIDCGNSWGDSTSKLKRALEDVYQMLPPMPGELTRKHLDLLVATHRHWDHLRGFDPKLFKKLFEDVQIDRIWLSAAMKKKHPQAKSFHTLQAFVYEGMESLEKRGLEFSTRLRVLMMKNIGTAGATDMLRQTLPSGSRIVPLYVYRDFEKDREWASRCFEEDPPEHPEEYLLRFKDKRSRLRVLAPEWDIDHVYLGKEIQDSLLALSKCPRISHIVPEDRREDYPTNISRRDFQRLRTRLMYTALAFAEDDSHLANDTSVVLLLEWRGRRLLFAGDAEWNGGYTKGARNGSWDVMVHNGELSEPLDFLKVGHHGSINGTPWCAEDKKQLILEKILPLPDERELTKTRVVVSTREGVHGDDNPVPYPKLMQELGRRAKGKVLRTDNPDNLRGKGYIEVTLDAASD